MNDIRLLTKLYELVELIGKEEVYKLLQRALDELSERIRKEELEFDARDARRRDFSMEDTNEKTLHHQI